MNEENDSELIEVVLGLLEKSKQQDESIQKAIEILENEKTALKSLKSDLISSVVVSIGMGVENALNEPKNAFNDQIVRVTDVVSQLQQTKRDLDWRNNLWYFGGFAVFMVLCFGLIWWLIPSLDEIQNRRVMLEYLTAQVEKNDKLTRLQISNCDKKLCVKVVENKCNYGDKDNRYCIAELRK